MKITEEELSEGITRVVIEGRLDIEGAAAIDSRMSVLANSCKKLLVDLQHVSFLASIGLRSLVIPAQTIRKSGGKIVLFGPNEMVGKILKISGIDTIIPVCHDLPSAIAALR